VDANRPCVDASSIGKREQVLTDIKCFRAALDCLEGGRDILRSADFEYPRSEAERVREPGPRFLARWKD